MQFILIALGIFMWFTPPSNVLDYESCTEPIKPACTDGYAFTSSYEFESCKDDVEAYIKNVKLYLGCVDNNTSNKNRRDVNHYNSEIAEKKQDVDSVIDDFKSMIRNSNNSNNYYTY